MITNVTWIALIPISCTAISALLAIIVYIRQQRLTRLQNLIAVFQRFSNNDDFISIFSLCDACFVKIKDPNQQSELVRLSNQLAVIEPEKKFKYLALLEEISILARNSEVFNKNAIHLFKFHFYYVYGNHEISVAFWRNLGSGVDEKSKEGWSYQNDFAKKCKESIEG